MAKPAVVLDTNVVVSAHLSPRGLERFVLDLSLAGQIQLCSSRAILDEYARVLARPKFALPPNLTAASLALISRMSAVFEPRQRVIAAADPDDNKFLECAEAARAEYLVTGNKRHFPPAWKSTRVVNARELIAALIPVLEP